MRKDNTTGKSMELTSRDEAIISDLALFGALTRDQIWSHHQFRSRTRVNATLLRLTRFDYISRRTQPTLSGSRRFVYLLGERGAELLDGPTRGDSITRRNRFRASSDLFLEHLLLVNGVRLKFADLAMPGFQLHRWMSDQELRTANLGIVPDGYIEYEINAHAFAAFVEVDRGTEALSRWTAKTNGYSQLAFGGRYGSVFGRKYFRVLVLGPSPTRVGNLRRVIARTTDRIFWLTTFDAFSRDGPFGSIWQRPADPTYRALTE